MIFGTFWHIVASEQKRSIWHFHYFELWTKMSQKCVLNLRFSTNGLHFHTQCQSATFTQVPQKKSLFVMFYNLHFDENSNLTVQKSVILNVKMQKRLILNVREQERLILNVRVHESVILNLGCKKESCWMFWYQNG